MSRVHYLDDSGDPGLGGSASSSSHYILAIVQLDERASLPELAVVRQTLHLSPGFEWKYHRSTAVQKTAFFNSTRRISFRVRAVTVDKTRLESGFARMSGQDLTVELISALILRAPETDIANDVLVIDGATPALRRALRKRLSDECKTIERVRPFKKIVSGDSERDDALQLADMIAGAIRHHVMGVESTFYRMVAGKVVDLWELPGGSK